MDRARDLYMSSETKDLHRQTVGCFCFCFIFLFYRGSVKQINLLNSQQWKLLGLSRIDILQLSIRKLKDKGSIFPQTNC